MLTGRYFAFLQPASQSLLVWLSLVYKSNSDVSGVQPGDRRPGARSTEPDHRHRVSLLLSVCSSVGRGG